MKAQAGAPLKIPEEIAETIKRSYLTVMTNPVSKKIEWAEPDGTPISCEEKLKVLNENLEEVRQYCQDAFEDAVLMGCDEARAREIFESVVDGIKNPYKTNKAG